MTEFILAALVSLLDPEHFLFLALGTMLGLVVGILPGLGGIAGLSLLLPFVYGKDPTLVLPMMIGLLASFSPRNATLWLKMVTSPRSDWGPFIGRSDVR